MRLTLLNHPPQICCVGCVCCSVLSVIVHFLNSLEQAQPPCCFCPLHNLAGTVFWMNVLKGTLLSASDVICRFSQASTAVAPAPRRSAHPCSVQLCSYLHVCGTVSKAAGTKPLSNGSRGGKGWGQGLGHTVQGGKAIVLSAWASRAVSLINIVSATAGLRCMTAVWGMMC